MIHLNVLHTQLFNKNGAHLPGANQHFLRKELFFTKNFTLVVNRDGAIHLVDLIKMHVKVCFVTTTIIIAQLFRECSYFSFIHKFLYPYSFMLFNEMFLYF
jgi:hypothetical protein